MMTREGQGSHHVCFYSSRRRHTRLQGDWSSDVCSSDLDGGLVLDSMRSQLKDLDIGPVGVRDFQINYTREASGGLPGDRWEGQGVACVPTGTCLDMAPPNGGVRIVGGELDRVGASLDFSPSIPLFPGIDMSRIGFAFGLDPTRFLANAELL